MGMSRHCWHGPPPGRSGGDVTYIRGKEVPSLLPPPLGHEAAQVTGTPCPRAMASPAPWLRWTQTELTHWEGEEEEEEEEEDDFERRMDEDGVIGLGEDAGSPPWGDGEDPEEGSPAEEGRWHPRRDLAEEDEERGSSRGDEEPWGAESDGEPYPELSYEGRWGSGSSGSPVASRDGRALCQPRGCSTDGGDTSGLSDTSPDPATPSRRHRGWGTAGDAGGGHGQGWTPSQSRLLPLSTDDLCDATSIEPVPEPQPARTGLPAPGTAGLAPTGEPWGAGTPPAPQLHDGSQVPKKAAPTVLPPKPGRPSRSLSPRRRHTGGKEARDPSGTGTGTAEGTQYGRGRLNHPLPDLSKVEARVKFDQSYRPPRGRALPARPRAPGGPIGFKSPAEIVREVLLSSGEGVPPQPPTTAGLPQEFRSPRQATELVQQLQDDYHKLLTKYAEAENTIDQLRLGARVSLYADPPRPSRSLAVGTVGTGCRVMALSIPQARTAAFSTTPAPAPPASLGGAPAPSDREGSPQPPPSPPPPGGGCPTCPGPCRCPGTQLTRTLAGQTHKLQAQVESFEGWIRAGSPTPQEQLQVRRPHPGTPPRGCTAGPGGWRGPGAEPADSDVAAVVPQRFRKLRDAQDALERAYLRARQQHPGASGEFDPNREVEGEIFRLGLRLEELKERLEPGARRQLPLQCPNQPRSPPAPSPPPAACSPHPESPALMEGPRGTAGDSEVATGGLPRPLWHKQLRVEEDFGDLVEQYKHFKSLPESLSLEQLSLAETGSQEEVDGPAAGDGGPSKVACRTQSLEEGVNHENSPLHPAERRAALLPARDPPWPGRTRGHLSPATAEEPPATAKPPLGLPEPPRMLLSCRSSRAGSAVAQHQPRKEQRIVSPETDSGFVGSEASRVSPPVHTPEHQPPGTGTPGLLGPSIPIPATLCPPRKREVIPLPSETALMSIYPVGRQGGTGGARLPPSTPSQGSAGSEPGPDGDGTHMDSEAEGRSCASAGGHPSSMARGPASPPPSPETPSPTPLSPDLPSLDPARCDLLGSRLERERPSPWRLSCGSRAIWALRDEVWRLQRRLEESLRCSRSYPEGKAAPARRQLVASGPSSPKDAASSGEPSPPVRGRVAPGVAVTKRRRSASLPRAGPELDLASESDPSPAGPRATPCPQKSPGSTPGVVTFRGQYTGTRYQAGMPRATPAPREEPGTPGCPRCHGSKTSSAGFGAGDAARQPQHSTPRRTRCPACRAPMGPPAPGSRDGATHAERGPGGTSPPGSRAGPRAEKPEQPGLWYLASPGATAAVGCLAPVPLVPYVPSVLYCSPAVPTSAPAVAGVPLQHAAGHRRAEHPPGPRAAGHHRCLTLGLEELEELNRSLSRAVEAAQSVRLTTTRMSRALAAELSRARDLRGSCLF
ncbi:microtubule organization protein AKNA isoform X1 [Accipiter gentilis]|uniref:microtubule organization protein AKNA isoform X1 n=2 Tax=Astur gentilis TaxID=8957 RepID=UPI00210FFB10|nr:microtubule organization protein AKNA isoform X1 [Accipiter gentilis]